MDYEGANDLESTDSVDHIHGQKEKATIIFKFRQAKLESKSGVVISMRSPMPIVTLLLFTYAALSFGWAFAEECIAASGESAVAMNETAANGTLMNMTNETLKNNTLSNETLYNVTLANESLENASLTNETLKNQTMPQNKTGYFEKVRGRQPSRK